jgi:hypothetical protein
MNYSKITGWLLLIAGITIIGWTLILSYNIFTTKAALPEFFEIPEKEDFISSRRSPRSSGPTPNNDRGAVERNGSPRFSTKTP